MSIIEGFHFLNLSIDFISDQETLQPRCYNTTLLCNLLSVVDILNLSLTIVLQFHTKKSYALNIE